MHRSTALALGPLLAVALIACGGDGDQSASSPKPAPAATVPPLASSPEKPGEFIFSGQGSPASHGPLKLAGAYLVRFEQVSPEDAALDFSGQTPFTATLQRRAGDAKGAVKLFGEAQRSGRRGLTISGRYVLDVSFGDFPYAVRFTPRR